jgi:16S rRNA (adenine1518-N6/adenine1519-N6)-dimethyltransferase
MKYSEIREILSSHGIQLTKSLGQNFLHDANQLEKIAAAAELTPADQVLEIGPGLGPLTELLIRSNAKVLAVELDSRLIPILSERFRGIENFELRHGDGVALMKEGLDWQEWKLVANLPYSVASVMLVDSALNPRCFKRIVVTLQWEVVNRIAAAAGTEDYGLLSLLIRLRYDVLDHFKIKRGAFFPPPDVDSGVITLERRSEELLPVELHPLFVKIVKLGFSQRRKMMKKLLKTQWSEAVLTDAFQQLGLCDDIRAEKVTLEQFTRLTEIINTTL